MTGSLKLTRSARGIELRRGSFDVMVDGGRVGSIEWMETTETPLEAGRHSLQVRRGRYSSRVRTFEVDEGGAVSFLCHGASIWPRWLLSYIVPSLGLTLSPEV